MEDPGSVSAATSEYCTNSTRDPADAIGDTPLGGERVVSLVELTPFETAVRRALDAEQNGGD
jgi:hypothetical protein